MDYIELGRTGARVSAVGVGCGGHSRLGMRNGGDTAGAAGIVRRALDLGITFIDTAEGYGTEEAVGLGVRGRRDQAFVSTKTGPTFRNGGGPISAADLRDKVETSLTRLGTDRIDLFNLHGVGEPLYDHSVEVLLPELRRLQEQGKIRFLGITEAFGFRETDHRMLQRALPDAYFDVVMVGFNLLNPSARRTVFPLTQRHRIGTLIMFAVRRALSQKAALGELLQGLETQQLVPPGTAAEGLDFVARDPEVHSLVEAAYRFCRHEPGADVILTGTGNIAHLEENIASILAPKLPPQLHDRLTALFGEVDTVSGN
jgi:aryl-alcohol dehydrogenase-like predicted oxidoreductase